MPNRLAERIASMDWNSLQLSLDEKDYAALPTLLDKGQCRAIIDT